MNRNPAPADVRSHDEPSGSADRTLRVLIAFADEGRPLSLAEISTRVGMPRPTAHRICNNLLAAGYLVRDVDERNFIVGPSLRGLAFNALNRSTLHGLRHGVLTALVEDLGETCNFTTLDGSEVLYLDRVEAKRTLRLTIDVGAHVPIHCTASGKLFLAHLPKRRRNAIIRGLDLRPWTPATITNPADLRAECDKIVEEGFAADREEFVAGLIAFSVPVRDAEGLVRAGVSVHAPIERLPESLFASRLERLRQAATAMSHLI